jgi:hypothetical protein
MAEGEEQIQTQLLSDFDAVIVSAPVANGGIEEKPGHGFPLHVTETSEVAGTVTITCPKVEPFASDSASQDTPGLPLPAQPRKPTDDRPRQIRSCKKQVPERNRSANDYANTCSAPRAQVEAAAGAEEESSNSKATNGTHSDSTQTQSHTSSSSNADKAAAPLVTGSDSTETAVTNGISCENQQTNKSGPMQSSPSSTYYNMSNPPSSRPGQQRQPILYPGPPYGASGISSQYGYGDSPVQAPPDPFRGSPPTGGSIMSLPSMRTFDPLQPPQHPSVPLAPHGIGMPGPPVPGGMMYYGPPQVAVPGQPYMVHDAMNSRYALPPNDPRAVLSGAHARHKKACRTFPRSRRCRKLTHVLRLGDQAAHEDWLLDLSQASNKGMRFPSMPSLLLFEYCPYEIASDLGHNATQELLSLMALPRLLMESRDPTVLPSAAISHLLSCHSQSFLPPGTVTPQG